MKHFVYFLVIALVVLVTGCRSTMQFGEKINSYDGAIFDTAHFSVLGPVSVEGYTNKGASYIEVFNKAKELYEGVDEVVNIHIDYKTLPAGGTKIVMTGVAIKYNR